MTLKMAKKKKKRGNRKKTELRWLSYGGGGDYLDKKKGVLVEVSQFVQLGFYGDSLLSTQKGICFSFQHNSVKKSLETLTLQ